MIPTNQLQITFDRAAIEKKFVILEVKRDSGNYQHSTDPGSGLAGGARAGRGVRIRCPLLYPVRPAKIWTIKI